MSLIDVQNLTFAYDGSYENIFENVSFQIDTDWRLGFVGRNGRGKTTFLRLLLGQYPYQGKISASVDFAYFPYPVEEPERTVAEVAERLSPGFLTWELERELAGLELSGEVLDRPYGSLSHGERTKVLLAILFLGEERFLLIDEPTNHLDLHGREVLSRYLRGKRGYLLVSHDRAFLDGCVDHILAINRADITLQKGNFSTWWENKQRQDAFELARDQRLRKDIRRLESAARQSRAWADRVESEKIGAIEHRERYNEGGGRAYIGEQSRRMQQRRKNLERRQQRAIEEKSALLKNREREETLKLTQLPYHKKRLLEVRDLTVDYGSGPVFRDLSFSLESGERLAILGPNGCGKSSVLKLLCGEEIPHTGRVDLGSQLTISYVSQDTSALSGSLWDLAERAGIDRSLFLTILRKLDFSRSQFEKDIADFSSGQKKKVLLARSLSERAHLFLWDEPMNFIDVLSRIQIEELLVEYRPTMIFVEHDRRFCEHIATRTLYLGGDGIRSGILPQSVL